LLDHVIELILGGEEGGLKLENEVGEVSVRLGQVEEFLMEEAPALQRLFSLLK
jgi:hypothetical protein